MGDEGPSISHNVMNVSVFPPYALKVESNSTSKIGRGMKRDGCVTEEGIRVSFLSREGEYIIII